MSFSELEEDVTTADNSAASNLKDMLKHMELNYALSLLRDAEYAHSGRKFMLALGENDSFRELYEGGKLYEDALKLP